MSAWIGYERVDRLLSYPQANNLSAWWQPIHIAATNPRNGSTSTGCRANAGNIEAAWQSRKGQATRNSGHHINTRRFFSTATGSGRALTMPHAIPALLSNFESKTLIFCGFRGAFQDMTGELRAKFMEVSPVRVWAGERNT